jgi:hypothetical protein
MAHDQFEDQEQTAGHQTARSPGRLVIAGVIGACALGVGLGLWARPATEERFETTPEPEAEAKVSAERRLQIVVDDTPAPLGPPLEVMPADLAAPAQRFAAPLAPHDPEPVVPVRSPSGLMKVTAPVAGPVAPLPPPELKPKARADTKATPEPVRARKAETKAAKADKPKKASKAVEAPRPKRAKAVAKAEKPAEAAKAKPVKQAKADKPKMNASTAKKAAKAPNRLAKVVKAVERAPKAIKVKVEKAAKPAKAAPKPKPKPAPLQKATVRPKPPAPRGEGPLRVARAAPCASADPGEALVCADPRLNQRDRQLQRAYQEAEAAGVPASALVRQQERWRAARAAAARDGSWAVEDVYEARIAELKDLARDARDY